MEFEVSGVKAEEDQFCHACFSVDRPLRSVGDLLDVFCILIENRNTVVSPVFCWECLALLRRVRRFRQGAALAQALLRTYQLDQRVRIPPPRSRLTVSAHGFTVSTAPSESQDVSSGPQGCLEGPPADQIKEEEGSPQIAASVLHEQFDVKDEIDVASHIHDDDWQNDDLDTDTLKRPHKPFRCKPGKTSKPRRYKYVREPESSLAIEKFCTSVPIVDSEMRRLLEQDRKDKLFLKLPHRCEDCVRGWVDERKLLLHNDMRHCESAGLLQCDLCAVRFSNKTGLAHHMRSHRARQCAACRYRCAVRAHLRRHVLERHIKSVKCRICAAYFHNVRDFFVHHRALHRQFLCDHCGKRCLSRAAIKKHLAKHGPFVCQECGGRAFKSHASLLGHLALRHAPPPPRPELAYCVECDRQFDTVKAFRRHLVSAVQHKKMLRKKPVPCPVCGKEYARATNMRSHYNYVHMNRSNYECRDCDMIFLNRTKYVRHMHRKHEAGYQAPRNKLCTFCGRGFSTNRILDNHIRTHTGERPFECTQCDAKFGQKIALKTHVKHIHLKVKRQPAQQLKFFQTC